MANEFVCQACGDKIRKPGIILNGDDYWTCGRCLRMFHDKCVVTTGFIFKDKCCPCCGQKLE